MKKRRIFSVILTIMLVFGLMGSNAFVKADSVADSGTFSSGVKWTYYSSGILELSGSGQVSARESNSSGDFNDYASEAKILFVNKGVTFESRFRSFRSSNLTKVTINDRNSALVAGMFEDCKYLTSVSLPEGITEIPQAAFNGCVSLKSIDIPSSVQSIGEYAFRRCPLASINLKNVKTIGILAFADNVAIKSITLPSSITEIEYSFARDTNLSDITFSKGIKTSGISGGKYVGAFVETAWEKKQSGAIYIGDSFYGYNGNVDRNGTLEIKEGTKSLCMTAMSGVHVKNLKLPTSISDFKNHPFIPEEMEGIYYTKYDDDDSYAANFDNIIIPSKVADIQYNVIKNTGVRNIFAMSGTKLESQVGTYMKRTRYFALDKSTLTLNSGKELMKPNDTKTMKVSISYKGNVADFSDFVVWSSSNSSVVSVSADGVIKALKEGTATITASSPYMSSKGSVTVEVLGNSSSSTKKLKVGSKVKDKTGKFTYKVTSSGTVSLISYSDKKSTSVTIPATVKLNGATYKVTAIGNNVFKNKTKLKKVTIGKNIKSIGASAFMGCKKLTSITIKSTSITKVGANAFKGINSKATIKVPKAKLKAYKKLFTKAKLAKTIKVK